MNKTLTLLLCLTFLLPATASAARRKKDRKQNKTEIPADTLTAATRRDTAVIAVDTLKQAAAQTVPEEPRKLTAKDTITDNDIVLPEGLANGVDTLISEEVDNLQPPVNRHGGNIDYPDSVYIQRLSALPAIIELPYNSVVKGYITLYTEKRRELVEKLLALNQYYEPIFEQEIDKQGLPIELKYLPVIESALRPNAVSPAGAAGLWQFMIGTARMMGLEVNSVVDERRDPIRSSELAAKYLKQLYEIYGDWSLAIASYNCGPGNVNEALRRAGGGKQDMRRHQPGRLRAEKRNEPAQQKRHARTNGRGLQRGVGVGDIARAREGNAAGEVAVVIGIGVWTHGIGQNSRYAQRQPHRQNRRQHQGGAAWGNRFPDLRHHAFTSQSASVTQPASSVPSSGETHSAARTLHTSPGSARTLTAQARERSLSLSMGSSMRPWAISRPSA